MRSRLKPVIILCVMLTGMQSLYAQERLDMEGTSVIGNKELPKVLYIVPWKSPEPLALTPPETSSVLDQPPSMIKRSQFRRQIQFHHNLYPPVDIR